MKKTVSECNWPLFKLTLAGSPAQVWGIIVWIYSGCRLLLGLTFHLKKGVHMKRRKSAIVVIILNGQMATSSKIRLIWITLLRSCSILKIWRWDRLWKSVDLNPFWRYSMPHNFGKFDASYRHQIKSRLLLYYRIRASSTNINWTIG